MSAEKQIGSLQEAVERARERFNHSVEEKVKTCVELLEVLRASEALRQFDDILNEAFALNTYFLHVYRNVSLKEGITEVREEIEDGYKRRYEVPYSERYLLGKAFCLDVWVRVVAEIDDESKPQIHLWMSSGDGERTYHPPIIPVDSAEDLLKVMGEIWETGLLDKQRVAEEDRKKIPEGSLQEFVRRMTESSYWISR